MVTPVTLTALLVLILLVVVPVVLLIRRTPEVVVAPGAEDLLSRADRYSRRSLGLAIAVGLLLAAAAELAPWPVPPASDGVMTMLAPSILGLGGLAVLAWRERRNPVLTTDHREAELVPRRVVDYATRPAAVLLLLLLAGIIALLVGGALLSGPDGRSLSWQSWEVLDGEQTLVSSTASPWPGPFYGIPMAVSLAIQLGIAAGVARLIAHRARLASVSDGGLDAVLRRRSMDGVLAFLLLSQAMTGLGIGAVTAIVERQSLAPGATALGALGLVVAALGLSALACALVLLLRHPRARVTTAQPAPVVGSPRSGEALA